MDLLENMEDMEDSILFTTQAAMKTTVTMTPIISPFCEWCARTRSGHLHSGAVAGKGCMNPQVDNSGCREFLR